MPSLRYLGPTSNDIDLVPRLRLQAEVSGTLTPALVDQQVTTALSPKADSFYVGSASSQRVTSSAITNKVSGLIPKSSANQPNGPLQHAGNGTHLYLPNSFERTGGRGWRRVGLGAYSPNTISLTTGAYSSTTEQQIGSFTIAGPNWAWFPIFVGYFTIGLGKGEVCIKQGSRYIARAIGGNDPNAWFTSTLVPMSSLSYFTGSITFTVTRRAVFSPGSTNIAGSYNFCCIAVPA